MITLAPQASLQSVARRKARLGIPGTGQPGAGPAGGQTMFTLYLNALLEADRIQARRLMSQCLQQADRVEHVYDTLLWPIIEQLDHSLRTEAIDRATHELAVRIHRQVCDQVAARLPLPMGGAHGRRAVLTCGAGEPGELAAQLVADRFEADGWEVYFLGGGVPEDDILRLVGKVRPQLLVVFASCPSELPGVRRLIDMIRSVNASPGMNVLVGGGVFNRAEGLAEEIGADLFAPTIRGVLEIALSAEPRPARPGRPGPETAAIADGSAPDSPPGRPGVNVMVQDRPQTRGPEGRS